MNSWIYFLLIISLFSGFEEIKWYVFNSDTDKTPICLSHPFKRIFLNDSIIIDQYYGGGEKPYYSDTFKIINQDWFYSLRGEFQPFLSVTGFNNKDTVRVFNNSNTFKNSPLEYIFVPEKIELIENEMLYCYLFYQIQESCFVFKDIQRVYFDPKDGIVAKYSFQCGLEKLSEFEK